MMMMMMKCIQEFINTQKGIKMKQFMKEELDTVRKKGKCRKAAGLNEIHAEV